MYYFNFGYKVITNTAALGALLFKALPTLLWHVSDNKTIDSSAIVVEDLAVKYDDILPQEIIESYGDIKVIKNTRDNLKISRDARKYFLGIWAKNLYRPFFTYWVFKELAFYSTIVANHSPKLVAVYVNERNIAGPIVKEYLESKNVKFSLFMHGVYLINLVHSFSDFSEYYIWDNHYKDLLINDLYCRAKNYIVYLPKKLQQTFDTSNESVDITYYLGTESEQTLKKIGEVFRLLKRKGKKCAVRRHPRIYNEEIIVKYIDSDQIQDPKAINVFDSIEQSSYIASIDSTVLLEALYGGKRIMLDDWSDPKRYQALVDRKSIMVYKPHFLLSEYLSEILGEDVV